jgi:hypothetical protein
VNACDTSTQAIAARVSRDWVEPGLNGVWHTLHAIKPLLEILSTMHVVTQGGTLLLVSDIIPHFLRIGAYSRFRALPT